MFLLCQNDVTQEDGMVMITLPNRLCTFAAFPTQELAESRYLYVFSAQRDINRLFSEQKKNRYRLENVMEIAKIRPEHA
jgi:hypothetical protein